MLSTAALTLLESEADELALTLRSRSESWQLDALCAEVDPELFYPERGGSTKEAKRVCLGCEVRPECLAYALDHDERTGVWGGLSERERRRLKHGAPLADPVPDDATCSTREACDLIGFAMDGNAAAKLRNLGWTPLNDGSDAPYRWDREQAAAEARARGRLAS